MSVAEIQCFVEIWPISGGTFFFAAGNAFPFGDLLNDAGIGSIAGHVLAATVERDIRATSGKFDLLLPPGGPRGVNDPTTWVKIFGPMSLCLIAMVRGARRAVVMVGVVRSVTEETRWRTGHGVDRVTVVRGADFGFFLETENWLSLPALLAGFPTIVTGLPPEQATPFLLNQRYVGAPDQVGRSWWDQIIAGSNGLFSATRFPYSAGSIGFSEATATLFEGYSSPAVAGGATIPFSLPALGSEGNWDSKFRDVIFPFPAFEFFFATMPSASSAQAIDAIAAAEGGRAFTMSSLGKQYAATPTLVARNNPFPYVSANVAGNSVSFTGIDTTRWQALPITVADTSFIESSLTFGDDEVKNVYYLDPTYFAQLYGATNSDGTQFLYQFMMAFDGEAIHRFGYRPARWNLLWMADDGSVAARQGANVPALVADLVSRLFSYHRPTPSMAKGTARFPLMPDAWIGTRLQYRPFKGGLDWEFYVRGVRHVFGFGGPSFTEFELERGLPAEIYGDTRLLTGLHLGQVEQIDGIYDFTGAQGVQPFDFTSNSTLAENLQAINRHFASPQDQGQQGP